MTSTICLPGVSNLVSDPRLALLICMILLLFHWFASHLLLHRGFFPAARRFDIILCSNNLFLPEARAKSNFALVRK
jgi:hypothetical protein